MECASDADRARSSRCSLCAEEDERFGEARGDELPGQLSTREGRQRWLHDARRRLDERRAREARPIPGPRPKRLKEAKRRLEEEYRVRLEATAAYEDYRRHGRMKNGRRLEAYSPPKPYQPPASPEGKINLSDVESRNVKTPRGWVQGDTAQAVTNRRSDRHRRRGDRRLAGLRAPGADGPRRPVRVRLRRYHRHAGGRARRRRLPASGPDGTADGRRPAVLIPPDANKRKGERPGWQGGLYAFMRRVLATDLGAELYARRQTMVEPVGHTKFKPGCDRFLRRGRSACRSEWVAVNQR
jgi:hypothetical protein